MSNILCSLVITPSAALFNALKWRWFKLLVFEFCVRGRTAIVHNTHITFVMCATIMGKLFRFEYNLYGCVYRWQLVARWSIASTGWSRRLANAYEETLPPEVLAPFYYTKW